MPRWPRRRSPSALGGAHSRTVDASTDLRGALQEMARTVVRGAEVVAVATGDLAPTGDVVADIVLETARAVGRRSTLPDGRSTSLVGIPLGRELGVDVAVRVPVGTSNRHLDDLQLRLRAIAMARQPA